MTRPEATAWTAAGHPVACPTCGGDRFRDRLLLMNTAGATFFNFDWANKEALCLVCARCGHLLWFHEPGLLKRAQGASGGSSTLP